MITDLSTAGLVEEVFADVLIIGGGTCGLPMADALSSNGYRVVCLESGAELETEAAQRLNRVVQTGGGYQGAEQGRFRCLGGTSSRWGGALIPFLPADMEAADWPVTYGELERWVPAVEGLFGLPEGPYEAPGFSDKSGTLVGRLAKWPPFANRNVFTLLRHRLKSPTGAAIWTNATATSFEFEGGRLSRVLAKTLTGQTLKVSAQIVVVAAGAIESTRLLLLMDEDSGGLISQTTPHLGKYFHDHLSSPVAVVETANRAALNRHVGFQFGPNGSMRNFRLEMDATATARVRSKPFFAHIAFGESAGGFTALRDIYRLIQQRRLPKPRAILELCTDLPWLARAVWWRYIERRLLYPEDAEIAVHLVTEQEPAASNAITLAPAELDPFGRRKAAIHWEVSPTDWAIFQSAAAVLESAWDATSLAQHASLKMLSLDAVRSHVASCGGVFHPGGSTRMGRNAVEGVVDRDLAVFGLSNVHVVATSVLPTGGGANPTMMLLLLALRCADNIARTLASHCSSR